MSEIKYSSILLYTKHPNSQLTKYYVSSWLCYPSYPANAAPLATLVTFFIKSERASASQISTSLAL